MKNLLIFKSGFYEKLKLLIIPMMLLTLGVGQMWAASGTITVYFKNTPGWSNVYVTFLTSSYWSDTQGSGAFGYTSKQMSYDSTLKLYKYTFTGSYSAYIAFTKDDQSGYGNFYNTEAVYRGDYSTSSPIYIPSSTSNETKNGTKYYNTGEWVKTTKRTVYFVNKDSWATPKAYVWNTYSDHVSWSGETMSSISQTYGGKTIYKYTTQYDFANVKFSNNGSSGTADLTLGSTNDGKMYYNGSWYALQYDIAFDEEGGSGGSYPSKATVGSTMPSLTTAPSKTGYNFGGYYDGDNGTGTKYWNADKSGAKTCAVDGPNQFYAKWTEKTYSLTFSHNGHGTIEVGGSEVSSESTASVNYYTTKTLVATPNTGYRFTGWTKSGSNTSAVTIADETSTGASTTIKATNTGATITAGFTAKTYTITLDKNGADGDDGSATATFDSNTLTSVTHPLYTDYRCDGYFTGKMDGTKIVNANGTLVASTSYTDGSGNWTYDGNLKLYAHWTYDVTNYTVTYGVGTSYTSLGSISAYNNTTSAAVGASPASVRSGHNVTFTASPNTGYEVAGFYSDASCTSSLQSGNTTTYTTDIDDDVDVYVKFQPITYTLTWSPSSAPTGCTYTTKPTTGTYGNTVTMVITPSTGYTVSVSARDASSNVVTISNPSTNTYTFTQPASAVTVTVSTSQIMSTLSTSCHYDVGTPGYAIPTKSVSSIGVATTATVTATAAGTGYTFAGWTLTNCTRTDGGGATANPITVRANGDGAAATVQANYTEDLSSPYTIKGGTNLTGNDWSTAYDMVKKTGHSTESVAYYTFNISSTNSGSDANKDSFGFKIINGSDWYGLAADGVSYWWTSSTTANKTLSTSGKNIQICANVAGPYEVKIDYSTPASPTVTVTFPTSYTLTYSIGSVNGTSGSISTSPTTASGSKVLSGNTVTLTGPAPKTGYSWKGWYTNAAGTEGKIADTDRAITVTMNADKTLYACYTENQYNVAVSAGAGGSVSPTGTVAVKQVTGTSLTATPSAGYSFNNWTISGGGITPNSSSTSPQTFKATTTGGTIRANFSEVMRTVTVAVNNSYLGSVSTTSLTSVGPATASAEVTATPVAGATFSGWTLPSGTSAASTYTSSSNPIKINATAADKTITANFTETKHTVSMSTADGSKGTVGAASASVGQITAVQITAEPKSGYMFDKWVKVGGSGTVTYYTGPGNGQLTDASGEEKETTYICVNGDVTLQATWAPDRSSGYVVYYGNDGKNADGGTDASQARAWKDGKLYRPSTAESNVSYFTFTAGVADVNKVIEFKVHKLSPSTWYGYNSADGGKIDSDISNVALNTSYGNGRMCVIMPGSYLFTWDKSTNKLSIRYPNDVYYLLGGFNSWAWSHPMTETSSGVYSATVNMTEANHTYSGDDGFKVLIAGKYYGKNSTTVTRSSSTGSDAISSCSTSGANIGLTTDYTGDYTFTYTVSTNTLQVTYPTAYKITFGKGSVNGSASNCSAVNLDNGNSAVTSNSTWVKSGHRVKLTAPAAKSGYTYDGWFSNNSGTGDAITTNANCTTTVNASGITRYACYHENMTTVTFAASPAGKGSFKIGGAAANSTTAGVTTTRSVQAVAGTGYRLTGTIWSANNANITLSDATANPVTVTGGGSGGTSTLTATFTPITYTIAFNANGGSGSMSNQGFTYDAAQALTSNAFTKTGYNFAGWATSAGGSVVYTNGQSVSNLSSTQGATVTLFAKWTPKTSALTLDKQTSATGYGGNAGTVSTSPGSATYGAAMPTLSGTMPTAANGYAFMGFYDEEDGEGTKYYNADGSSAHNWDKDTNDGTTLYAYYKKAEITAITFDAVTVESEGTVRFAVTVSPTPVGDKILCFTVLHGNDNPLSSQPDITYSDGKYSFTAPAQSGTYKVQVVLRTGTSCGGGTELDTKVASFNVASVHTVTIQYKCGDLTIKPSTTVSAQPLSWSEIINAPEIVGYTFQEWVALDGVTIKNGESVTDTTVLSSVQIKAIYDGILKANYTKKNVIYFNNTLSWDTVFVYFYENGNYWNDTYGTGANQLQNFSSNNPYWYGEHGGMKRVEPGSNIWYFDYQAAGYNTFRANVVFADQDQSKNEDCNGNNECIFFSNNANVVRRGDHTTTLPMFVPLASQNGVKRNDNKATYYNHGYWMNYPENTGYTLQIYNSQTKVGADTIKTIPFVFPSDYAMPLKLNVDLEAGKTYGFEIIRTDDNKYSNTSKITANVTNWKVDAQSSYCGLQTTAAGDYEFTLSYFDVSGDLAFRVGVTYPVALGDYRLLYKDNVHSAWHPSAVIPKASAKDTVSFFVRTGKSANLKLQKCTALSAGSVTWTDTITNWWSTLPTAITQDSVYNICLKHNATTGKLEIEAVEAYTGNYYIRTDCANSKWDNYKTDPDHLMTYSEYSINHGGYSHYYCHWVKYTDARNNIKFVVANDYSPCISDTLTRETASGTWANIDTYIDEYGNMTSRNANVRFMWNQHDNTVSRAYVDGAQGTGSNNFLYMLSEDGKIKKSDGSALSYNKVEFSDKENWIYEANIKAQANAAIKLLSNWGESSKITQYFKGGSSTTEKLIGGSGSDWNDIRVIYDYKTNRLIAALVPAEGTYESDNAIEADVMFIREHQGDIAQLTFSGDGKISEIKTAYGVMRFNKWTLANKETTGSHAPLAYLASIYERSLYWISFPFRVKLSEVFGFGDYGEHWAIQRYDGAARAAQGHFLENGSFWRWMDRKTEYLEANQGYLLAIDLDLLGIESDVWGPDSRSDRIELYFPSYGKMSDITSATVTQTLPEHECTINRAATEGLPDTGDPRTSYNRTIFDSHWNVMSVPTYVNTDDVTFANITWTGNTAGNIGPNFLYTWNSNDNTITATTASGYEYHAMFSYMVQYYDDVTWDANNVSPIVARKTYEEAPSKIEFRLELQQNEKEIDRTYVVLSNDEETSASFRFGEDMTKEFNARKSAIYTFIPNEAIVAGNTLPMSEQTTIVPVGVDIKTAGEYTFAIPEGTDGVGVTLVDNVLNTHTSLSALSYTVNLTAGTHDGRFVLEISPVHGSTTGMENSDVSSQNSDVRKMIIDQKLFIIKGDKMYDARGAMVK